MKKNILIILLSLSLLLVVGCTPAMVCVEPNKIIDNTCCIDNDNDNICDEDIIIEEHEPEVEEITIEVLPSEAEVFAEKFRETWEKNSYTALQNLFETNYRMKDSSAEFNFLARRIDENLQLTKIVVEKVYKDEVTFLVTEKGNKKRVVTELIKEGSNYKAKAFYFFETIDVESACQTNECFVEFARISGNSNVCELAGELRLDCLEEMGQSKDIVTKTDECLDISEYYTRVECLTDLAVKEQIYEPCFQATYNKQIYTCVGDVVGKHAEAEDCETAVEADGHTASREQHAYCILAYVKETHDTDACDLIDRRDDTMLGSMQECCYKENCH